MDMFRTVEFVKHIFFRKSFSGIQVEIPTGKVPEEQDERPAAIVLIAVWGTDDVLVDRDRVANLFPRIRQYRTASIVVWPGTDGVAP